MDIICHGRPWTSSRNSQEIIKKKINRQLPGQSSSTPFISIQDSHSRKVSFDTREELGDHIYKLAVMIGKLATRDSGSVRQLKPQIYQGRGRGQNRGNYYRHNYDQWGYQNKHRSDSGDSTDRTEVGLGMSKLIGEVISGVTWGILTDKIAEEIIEIITEMTVLTEAGTGLGKGHFPETLVAIEIGVQATVGPGQDQEQAQIETE